MGGYAWFTTHWFDLIQTAGIVGGLVFTAHALRRDEMARRTANLIAMTDQYQQVWKELYERPELSRVLEKNVNLDCQPISDQEELFVNLLILHLDCVHQAQQAGMFMSLEGLQTDINGFFSLPIPKVVWDRSRRLRNHDFVRFVETCLAGN